MANSSTVGGAVPAPKSLPARFIGIIISPRDTFAAVAAHPKWLGMLALTVIVSAILLGGFLSTEVGQNAWLKTVTSGPMNREMTDQQYATMERMAGYAGYIAAGQAIIFTPIMCLIMAAILFAVFNAALGGDASFKQVFAVVVHTGPIMLLGQLFTIPLNYAKGTMTSATSIGVLLPMLDDESFAGRLLGMIDLFWIWYLIVLAIGLAVLYRRRTGPIATALLIIYACIVTVIAAVMSR